VVPLERLACALREHPSGLHTTDQIDHAHVGAFKKTSAISPAAPGACVTTLMTPGGKPALRLSEPGSSPPRWERTPKVSRRPCCPRRPAKNGAPRQDVGAIPRREARDHAERRRMPIRVRARDVGLEYPRLWASTSSRRPARSWRQTCSCSEGARSRVKYRPEVDERIRKTQGVRSAIGRRRGMNEDDSPSPLQLFENGVKLLIAKIDATRVREEHDAVQLQHRRAHTRAR